MLDEKLRGAQTSPDRVRGLYE